MRKLLTTALAVAALTSAAPAEAQAACSNWRPDTENAIYQGNGWAVILEYAGGQWWASARAPGQKTLWGNATFSSWTADLVQFTMTWDNGSGGIYTGRIDANGFVSGTTEDRWTHATTTWRMRDVAICAG